MPTVAKKKPQRLGFSERYKAKPDRTWITHIQYLILKCCLEPAPFEAITDRYAGTSVAVYQSVRILEDRGLLDVNRDEHRRHIYSTTPSGRAAMSKVRELYIS